MNDNLILILAILASTLIGAYLGMLFTKLKSKSEKSTLEERQNQLNSNIDELKNTVDKIELEREEIRREKELLNTKLTRKNADYENLQEQNLKRDKELEERQNQLRQEFKLLANTILEEKSKKFTDQNKEQIQNILDPLQEKIKGFEKKVEETQKESIGMHSALKEQLKGLKDLNLQMTKEATNLTKALKGDSKMQGNWGELVLERVLEKSGLEKDREYFVQQSFSMDDGSKVLPDVVLHLPDNKRMIIDSKVSLTDYERLTNAEDTEKELFLKAHVNSIKKHVDQLSEKNYQDLYDIESPDFVLMFIPIEPAFAIAVNKDNSLYNTAFEKNIVIVTPSTLLATLRTIDSMWNNEKQQQNAIEIAKQAGRLYDQFVNLTDDLLKVGNQLNTVKGSYDSTMKKLTGKGNLLTKVENIKKLGIKANKHLNEKLLKKADEED
ncbi:MAG: DNA recombination protein RmuC [Flavobacteriaceae bacterium]|nr:DNA recombination protein RmuC [Bacteroidia bacterium]NNL16959.1 DNA recombination protein RmuC [Flavobacteriaceae bacterium]